VGSWRIAGFYELAPFGGPFLGRLETGQGTIDQFTVFACPTKSPWTGWSITYRVRK
jgi:hypothetical protein